LESNRNTIADYRDLVVWKEAIKLAVLAYGATRVFPSEGALGLTSQMRRSASSIPANIAEGFGRQQRRAFTQFLRIAQGLLKELESHSVLAARVGILQNETLEIITASTGILGKRLISFIRSLEKSPRPT
jgi:four helix bundle protein